MDPYPRVHPRNAMQGENRPSVIELDVRESQHSPWFAERERDDDTWPADNGAAHAYRARLRSEETKKKQEWYMRQKYLQQMEKERAMKQAMEEERRAWEAEHGGAP